ncbi:MAG: heterocyst frequency control protein PatD [Sphaerospermopsis sp. SIO1G1]|nr:heterocyst frequency control protein PatD [Sphaerospermopsis sp. SIO1G1]
MSVNLETYQKFQELLELFAADLCESELDIPGLRQRLTELQQYFVTEIASLVDVNSRQQSYHTEISKQLRLLELDVMFLQGAKKLDSIQKRSTNVKERINTLTRYCQAIIYPEHESDQ